MAQLIVSKEKCNVCGNQLNKTRMTGKLYCRNCNEHRQGIVVGDFENEESGALLVSKAQR